MVILNLSGPIDNPEIAVRRELPLSESILYAIEEMGREIGRRIARVERELDAARPKVGRF